MRSIRKPKSNRRGSRNGIAALDDLRFSDDAPLLRAAAVAFRNGIERHASTNAPRAPAASQTAGLLEWSKAYLPHYFTKPPSAMHAWLAGKCHDIRRNRGRLINLVGPRGAAKSTVGNTANVIRCAVENGESYIWIVSETVTLANKQLHSIKEELQQNQLLAGDYRDATGIGPEWSASRIRLRNDRGTVIEAIGKGQAIRGSRNRADRPTLVICDDLQDEKAAISADQRTKDWEWFTGSLMNAGDHRTNFINLSNAVHREAIGMRLLVTPGWESAVFSAIIAWPERMDLWAEWEAIFCDVENPNAVEAARAFFEANREAMTAGAKLLWEEWEDLYFLMCLRVKNGRSAFEREKQSRPMNPENCEWPEEYFSDNDAGGIWFDAWPADCRVRTVALDPSKGRDARAGDYSAYAMLAIGMDGTLYVDVDMARRPVPAMVADGCEIIRRFQPDAFGVESNAWQDLLGGEFERAFLACGMLSSRPYEIDNRINKLVRIRRLGPFLSQRRMLFKRNSPGVAMLLAQLKDFPNGDHDDGPDALEMAVRMAGEILNGVGGAREIGVSQVVG